MKRKRRGRPPKSAEGPSTFMFEMALSHALLLQCSALQVEQSLDTQVSAFSGSPVKLSVKRDLEDRVSFIFSDAAKEDLFNLADDQWTCSINDIVYEGSTKSSDDYVPDLEELDILQEDLNLLIGKEEEGALVEEKDAEEEMVVEEEEVVEEEKEDEEEGQLLPCEGRYHTSQEVKEILRDQLTQHACKVCQRTFSSAQSLHRHVAIMHKMSPKEYEDLGEAIVLPKPVRQVRRAKRKLTKDEVEGETAETVKAKDRIVCRLCLQNFSSLSTCRTHVIHKHKGDKRMDAFMKEIEANRLKACKRVSSISLHCIVCNEECAGLRIFSHLKTWHPDLLNLDEVLKDAKQQYYRQKNNSVRGKKDALAKCPHCLKEMKATSIYCHVKFRCKHNSERRKLYECSMCGFGSVFEDVYLEHKKTHGPGQKNYTCAECGKSFRSKSGLHMHQRKQHGFVMKVPLKHYHCELCQKTYTERSRYDKHMKNKHSGEEMCTSCLHVKKEGHVCDEEAFWVQDHVVGANEATASLEVEQQQQQQQQDGVVYVIDSQLMHNEQLPEELVQTMRMSSESSVHLPQDNQEVDGLYGSNFIVDEATLNTFMEDKSKWAVFETTVVMDADKTVVSQPDVE